MTRFRTLAFLLLLALPSWAEGPVQAKDAVVLSFRIKIAVPEAGKTRAMEVAPKVVVLNDQNAQISVDTPNESQLSLKVHPRLTGKESIELTFTVSAILGGTQMERRVRLISLLGSPALVELDDGRKGETLTIWVTPTRQL